VDCIVADTVAPTATLDFKGARVSELGEVIGEFELVNFDAVPGLAISLEREAGRRVVTSAYAVLEFEDMNGTLVELMRGRSIEGHVRDPNGVKVVKPGQRLTFDHRLFMRHMLKYAGTEFRLTLYTEPPTQCVHSFPFKAVPAPASATGLRAVPHPAPIATGALSKDSRRCNVRQSPVKC
jgi:hypothetical protein